MERSVQRFLLQRSSTRQHIRFFGRSACYRRKYVVTKKATPTLPNLATPEQQNVKSRLKRNLFYRFFNFIETYGEKVLSKILPEKLMTGVKLFSRGTKLLFNDMREYQAVNQYLSKSVDWEMACKGLSSKQLEVYLSLPSQIIRVSPVLILSAFPMAQNVIFPIAMMYPTYLLSPHFYTEQQQMDAFFKESKLRQTYYSAVIRDLSHSQMKNHFLHRNVSQFENEREILKTILHSESKPDPQTVLQLKPLFVKGGPKYISPSPYDPNTSQLKALHVKHLMKIHRIRGSMIWFPRFRILQHANMIHAIDRAIVREGGPSALYEQQLFRACHLRGLNIREQSKEDLIEYLLLWLEVSKKLDIGSMSMLLHLPILIGYNHPSRIWDDYQ